MRTSVAVILSLALAVPPTAAQNETFKITVSDRAAGDDFGIRLDLQGDLVVIGAGRKDTSGAGLSDEGAAYLFEFDGFTWFELQKLVPASPMIGAQFGNAVALDGNLAAIAAWQQDIAPSGDEGSVFVFQNNGSSWDELQELVALDAAPGDRFGTRIAMDAGTLLIGAQNVDATGSPTGDEGAAYVFTYDGSTYSELQKLVASDAEPGELFGRDVAIDGDYLIVGALNESDSGGGTVARGAAYVFERVAGVWSEIAKLNSSDAAAGDNFGGSTSISGDLALIGSPLADVSGVGTDDGAVYAFERIGSSWVEVQKITASNVIAGDQFGFCVDLEGDLAVIGARRADVAGQDSGEVYFFRWDGASWNEVSTGSASDGAAGDNLGRHVSISGQTAMVGAQTSEGGQTQAGSAYVFEAPPAAAFFGAPLTGPAPLDVTFTDLSSGQVSSWAWDFGDGGTSSVANPNYTYANAGTYTVTLIASGPGGPDSSVQTDYVTVDEPPRPGLMDGSFEGQQLGAPPTSPWSILFGAGHLVNPSGVPNDHGLPSEGLNWCEVSAEDTVAAIPPFTPCGPTSPPIGGAGIFQQFSYLDGLAVLQFEASFLIDGPLTSLAFNDWMSVDITDGGVVYNLYYADSFSAFPDVSAKYGLPMTSIETVSKDLSVLFPSSTTETVFTLTIQVGNGGDGLFPSRGYVDDFRLTEPATATVYGCGLNPAGSMTILNGLPRLGTTMDLGIDNPVGTQAAGSFPIVYLATAPDPAFPCGTTLPNFGMNGPGELLLDLGMLLQPAKIGSPWAGPGIPAPVSIATPNLPGILGLNVYAQGLLFDPIAAGGVKIGLTDAVELLVGP